MLVHVKFPHEPFNTAVRNGSAGKTIERILSETKPEAVYFTEYDGRRGAILIVDIKEPSQIPALAEPWFLSFSADVSAHIVMVRKILAVRALTPLARSGREAG
jgi:hypothetical protein